MTKKNIFLVLMTVFYICSLYFFYIDNKESTFVFLIFHCISIICASLSFYLNKEKYKNTWIVMVILISLCMPLVGIFFILILAFQSNNTDKTDIPVLREINPGDNKSSSLPTNQNHQTRIIKEKINLQSFIDIIHSRGNETLKIKFINLLSENISPNSIKLIKQAMRDESSEVKIIAVSTLKKIEKPLLESIQKSYKKTELNPSDESAWYNLGLACLKYCKLGIPDDLNTANYLKQSENAFLHVLSTNPQRTDTYLKLSEIFFERGEYIRAMENINKCLFFFPNDNKGYILKCEILFRQKKLKQLREFLKQTETTDRDELHSLKAVWA